MLIEEVCYLLESVIAADHGVRAPAFWLLGVGQESCYLVVCRGGVGAHHRLKVVERQERSRVWESVV